MLRMSIELSFKGLFYDDIILHFQDTLHDTPAEPSI